MDLADTQREAAVEKLLKYFRTYYNITRYEAERLPLVAFCEYYEHSQKYVLSRKAELWSESSEEFVYLFQIPHLTLEVFEQCRAYAYEDGMKYLNIGPGHMCSVISPIILCDTCDEDARRALKKCRIYKSFHFSLHGWMDFRVAAVILQSNRIERNRSAHTTAKILKRILYPKKKRERDVEV